MKAEGFVVIRGLLNPQHAQDMHLVASETFRAHRDEVREMEIDANQIDIAWDMQERLRLMQTPPKNAAAFLRAASRIEDQFGHYKTATLRVLKERLAPLVARIFEQEEVGNVENFSCLYMTQKQHRAQQWHIDMRSDERLLVFVGLEDDTARVEFFSERFEKATKTAWGTLRAGNVEKCPSSMVYDDEYKYMEEGDREMMRPYATALKHRRTETEKDILVPKLHRGDVLVAFANLLHRGPKQDFVGEGRGLWNRLVGFGTISKRTGRPYSTLDQCMGTLCTANVDGVASNEFMEEVSHVMTKEKNRDPLTVFDPKVDPLVKDIVKMKKRKGPFLNENGIKQLRKKLREDGDVATDGDEYWKGFEKEVRKEVKKHQLAYNQDVITGVSEGLNEKLRTR